MVWMIIGIGFFGIMFGNMTNLLDQLDQANKSFQEKIAVLKEYRTRTNIKPRLYSKIRTHLETNQKNSNNYQDQETFLRELPLSLRNQVVEITHGEIIDHIYYLKDKQ